MKEYNVLIQKDNEIVLDCFNTLETIICICICQFKKNFKIIELKENWFLNEK